jgi:colicin import membrane protein
VTGTQEISIQLGGLRRRELHRLFAISAIAHLALIAAFGFSPKSRVGVPRGVVAVELVSAPAAARPAVPAPVAKPVPVKPAPPKPKKVVLPAEPRTPKVKPKVVKPAVVEKPPPAKPTPAPEEKLEDVLAQFRAESGEDAPPVEIAKAAPTAIGSPGAPDGIAISPEVAAWIKRAKIHVRRNWVVPPGFRTQALEAHVEVDLDASGGVRGTPRLSRRSGNPWYDEGVISAIQKSSPLPPPPEAGKWPFVFLPEDSY